MDKKKKRWILKRRMSKELTHTSFKASFGEVWYFDSGCSRHVTSIKKFLVGIKPSPTKTVTYQEISKGRVMGVGKLDFVGNLVLIMCCLLKG